MNNLIQIEKEKNIEEFGYRLFYSVLVAIINNVLHCIPYMSGDYLTNIMLIFLVKDNEDNWVVVKLKWYMGIIRVSDSRRIMISELIDDLLILQLNGYCWIIKMG